MLDVLASCLDELTPETSITDKAWKERHLMTKVLSFHCRKTIGYTDLGKSTGRW